MVGVYYPGMHHGGYTPLLLCYTGILLGIHLSCYDTRVCTMVGILLSSHTTRVPMVGIHLSSHTTPYRTLGIPQRSAVPGCHGELTVPAGVCSEESPGLKGEINNEEKPLRHLRTLKGVKKERVLCAESFRLPEDKWMKEWITSG